MWFLLLFFAGITSSVALAQPALAFLQDEFKIKRANAAMLVGVVIFLFAQPIIFFMKFGYLDQIDFWVGTFGLVLFSVIEIIIFSWIFGMKNAWAEIHRGADLKLPRIFYFVMKYISPVYLLVLLVFWVVQDVQSDTSYILLKGASTS